MSYRYRTFIAVEVQQFSRDRLRGLQEQLAGIAYGVKWVEPRNMHLTLLFLGEIDARDVPKLCKTVEQAVSGFAPFSFSVAGLGAFPTPRRPRVLIAQVEEGAE